MDQIGADPFYTVTAKPVTGREVTASPERQSRASRSTGEEIPIRDRQSLRVVAPRLNGRLRFAQDAGDRFQQAQQSGLPRRLALIALDSRIDPPAQPQPNGIPHLASKRQRDLS